MITIYDRLTIIPARTIAEETLNIATAKNITIYDATYIAAAQKIGGVLYTADQKLDKTAKPITKTKLLKPSE